MIFEREQISSKVAYKGFCFEIINTLRSKLNFTQVLTMFYHLYVYIININVCRYDVITAADGEFGAQLSNGSWTGMIGSVINNKVLFIV